MAGRRVFWMDETEYLWICIASAALTFYFWDAIGWPPVRRLCSQLAQTRDAQCNNAVPNRPCRVGLVRDHQKWSALFLLHKPPPITRACMHAGASAH